MIQILFDHEALFFKPTWGTNMGSENENVEISNKIYNNFYAILACILSLTIGAGGQFFFMEKDRFHNYLNIKQLGTSCSQLENRKWKSLNEYTIDEELKAVKSEWISDHCYKADSGDDNIYLSGSETTYHEFTYNNIKYSCRSVGESTVGIRKDGLPYFREIEKSEYICDNLGKENIIQKNYEKKIKEVINDGKCIPTVGADGHKTVMIFKCRSYIKVLESLPVSK